MIRHAARQRWQTEAKRSVVRMAMAEKKFSVRKETQAQRRLDVTRGSFAETGSSGTARNRADGGKASAEPTCRERVVSGLDPGHPLMGPHPTD